MKRPKIITMSNLKGGTGKTTVTLNTSAILAENGRKVLAIDCDAQANMTHRMGVTTKNINHSIKDIFEGSNISITSIIKEAPIPQLPKLDLIPSSFLLAFTESTVLPKATLREFILANYLGKNKEALNKYDYIILDTNPSFGIVNLNAYLVSDAIIMVNEPGIDSLDGSLLIMDKWQEIINELSDSLNSEYKNNICGFLINRYDARTNASKIFVDLCKNTPDVRDLLFNTVIPSNSTLSDSMNENKPITLYRKAAAGYKALFAFTNELLIRMGEPLIQQSPGRPKKTEENGDGEE